MSTEVEHDTTSRMRPALAAVLAVVTAVVAFLVGQVVAVLVLLALPGQQPPWVGSVLALVADAVTVALVVLVAARWYGQRTAAAFGFRRPVWWKAVLLAVLGFVVYEAIAIGYNLLIGTTDVQDASDALIRGGGLAGEVLGVLAVAVLVPIAEEIVFRGFVYPALARAAGPWVGAVLGGLVFAAVHIGSTPWAQLLPLFVLGFVACVLVRLTGSLLAPIMLHCLNNGLVSAGTVDWGAWTLPVFVIGAPLLAVLLVLPFTRRAVAEPAGVQR